MLVHALSTALLALAMQLPAQTGSVRGEVRSEQSGDALDGASVEVVDASPRRATASNEQGQYTLQGVPAGRHTLRARRVGYAPLEVQVMVPAGGSIEIDIALSMTPITLAPVKVGGVGRPAARDSAAAPAGELAMAGVRAMQTSPGIAEMGLLDAVGRVPGEEPPDPSDVLYVRGTGADLKLVYLDGAPVYAPFPLGGILDAFTPGLLSSAEVYLGGAPARYDGGLSYILDLRTRSASSERVRTSGAVDLLSARALVEVPIGTRGGVLASGRGVHDLATRFAGDDYLPYGYREGLVRADLGLGSAGDLSLTAFANGEHVWLDSIRSDARAIQWGNRSASLRYSGRLGETAVELTGAVGDFRARLPLSAGAIGVAEGDSRRARLAGDAVSRLYGLVLRYGASFEQQRQEYRALGASSGGDWREIGQAGEGSEAGLYLDAGAQLAPRLSVRGGLRADHFSLGDQFILSPRLSATLMMTERAALTLAAGQYHQYVRPSEAEVFMAAEGPPLLAVQPLALARATHVSLGLGQDLGEGIRLGLEGFYKEYDGIPSGLSSEANASGMDLWVRRGTGDWRGWLGYSLAWTWSTTPGPAADRFSGRHLLSTGVSAPVGQLARLDLGFTYGAGLPYSAVPFGRAGVGEQTFSAPSPARDAAYRMETLEAGSAPLLPTPTQPYLRVDLEASGTWSPHFGDSEMHVTPYLRLLNTLGERDALFYRAADNADGGLRPLVVLPVVPVIGVEWTF